MVPQCLHPLTIGEFDRVAIKAATQFLMTIWDYDDDAYTFIGTQCAGRWIDHSIRGDRAKRIKNILNQFSPITHDVYFCPNAFSRPQRHQEYALPTKYAHCDIDYNNPNNYKPKPNVIWETSRGSFQGIWIWSKPFECRLAQQYSKSLVYTYGGDTNGWSVTKMLRVPGTINHKPNRNREVVRLVRFDDRARRVPDALKISCTVTNPHASAGGIDPFRHDPEAVMRRYRLRMGLSAGSFMRARRIRYHDRSGAVAAIIAKLVELGADNDEIAAVVRVNIYFTDKWGDDLDELERQILKIRSDVEAGR